MATNRQQLIHLHGIGAATVEKLNQLEFTNGEIAVRNDSETTSELYVKAGDKLAVFETKAATANAIDSAVNTVKTDLTTEINKVSTAVSDEVTNRTNEITRVEGLISAEATAREQAINTEVSNRNTAIADAIAEEVKNRNAAVEGAKTAASEALAAAVQVLEAADTALDGKIDAAVDALEAVDTELRGLISAETTARENADKGLQDAIDAINAAIGEGDEGKSLADRVETLEGGLAQELLDRAAADADLQDAIDGINEAIGEDGLEGRIKTLEEDTRLDTLIGDDANMSARAIVQDEVAAQLKSENISESFDTLKEMAEWLSSHPADVQEMSDAISANATAISNEETARKNADDALQLAINGVSNTLTTFTGTTYVADKAVLEEKDGELEDAIGEVSTALTTFKDTTYATDKAAIEKEIDDNKAAIEESLADAVEKLEGADADLQDAIDKINAAISGEGDNTLSARIAALEGDLAQELLDRAAADTGLDNRIKELESFKTNNESVIANAVQTISVNSGVSQTKTGTKVALDFTKMVINCGSYEA